MDRTERFYKIQTLLKHRGLGPYIRKGSALTVLDDQEGVSRQELPDVWFSEREIHALLPMIELIEQLEPSGFLSPRIEPLRLRLEQLLGQGTGSAAQAVNRIRILTMGQRTVSRDDFQWLTHALISRKRFALNYYNRKTGETVSRVVSLQCLIYCRDYWYLNAYCCSHEGLRSFAMDAIE